MNKGDTLVLRLRGFATSDDIMVSRADGRPNTLFLSVGEACNLNCRYCYTDPKRLRPNCPALTPEEQDKLLIEAADMGVRYLIIPGPGEPLLYVGLSALVQKAASLGMYITIITNGTNIDRQLAMFYQELPVSFMVKLNSLNPDNQDYLLGKKGMAEKIYNAINILIETGFTGYPDTRLAIDTLICKQAIKEVPDIVRFSLNRNIFPVVERLLALGRGLSNRDELEVAEEDAAATMAEVHFIMGQRRGNEFTGIVCDLHDYTFFVDVDGIATKCVGGQRDILIGDWRKESLKVIWRRQLELLHKESLFLQKHTCDQVGKCPGRRYCETKYGIN